MKISVRFSLVQRDSTDLPIRMRISYLCHRLDIRTGYVCPVKSWDAVKMRVAPGARNRYGETASIINARLAEQEAAVNKILTSYELAGKPAPAPSVLKEEFDAAMGRSSTVAMQVGPLFQKYISEMSKAHCWASGTLAGYKYLYNQLSLTPLASMDISSFSLKDVEEFVQHLIGRGLKNATIKAMTDKMNCFLKWCHEKELYSGGSYKPSLKGTSSKREIAYLEWDEVLRFKDAELKSVYDRIARDCFCLQCFTGLRVVDVVNLSWSQVHLNDSVPFIVVTIQKTATTVRIELNRHAIDIIKRYPEGSGEERVFPHMSFWGRNFHLKKIASSIGISGTIIRTYYNGGNRIDERVNRCDAISTHWGRHSFIVHALSLGVPPNVVMQWTGHHNYDAMKPYINISDKTRIENMALFDRV